MLYPKPSAKTIKSAANSNNSNNKKTTNKTKSKYNEKKQRQQNAYKFLFYIFINRAFLFVSLLVVHICISFDLHFSVKHIFFIRISFFFSFLTSCLLPLCCCCGCCSFKWSKREEKTTQNFVYFFSSQILFIRFWFHLLFSSSSSSPDRTAFLRCAFEIDKKTLSIIINAAEKLLLLFVCCSFFRFVFDVANFLGLMHSLGFSFRVLTLRICLARGSAIH